MPQVLGDIGFLGPVTREDTGWRYCRKLRKVWSKDLKLMYVELRKRKEDAVPEEIAAGLS